MKKILIEIGHPAHVHQFKNMYWELEKKGWKGLFVTKDKECAIDLLKSYNLPHEILGVTKKGIASKILSLPYFAIKMFKVAISFNPDVFVSRVSPLSGWSSFLLRKPHITFTDTENVKLLDSISEPFADVVLTSTSYLRDHGKKHIRYPGYHELAYLHPNRFDPNPKVLEKLDLESGDKYVIVRFVLGRAHHDFGHRVLNEEQKKYLVDELSKKMRVFISSEGELPPCLEKYRLKIPAHYMHHVLDGASLFVGESATIASECACLGVPSVYINDSQLGYTNEQQRYGLLYSYSSSSSDQDKAIRKSIELASDGCIKTVSSSKKNTLLSEKIDVTAFMVWFVENYPKSLIEASKPDFCYSVFK